MVVFNVLLARSLKVTHLRRSTKAGLEKNVP